MTCPRCDQSKDEIEAYGDIAGIGVMISFIVTASMLVALIIGYYLVAFDPEIDPFPPKGEEGLEPTYPNLVDRAFLRAVRAIPRTFLNRFCGKFSVTQYFTTKLPEDALIKLARSFSDISIFTGFAILISGFNAYTCDLQSYHWQIIIYLAWLATITHTSLLSILRTYLLNHRRQLWWRCGGMFIVFVMLVVAIGITSDFTWDDGHVPSGYARCDAANHPDNQSSKKTSESKGKLLLFVISGSIIRVVKLFRVADNGLRQWSVNLSDLSDKHHKGWEPFQGAGLKERFIHRILIPPAVAYLRVGHLHLELWTSFLSEVVWAAVSFAWATKRLMTIRSAHSPLEENDWTFGQVFPVVLLAAPFATIVAGAWTPTNTQTRQQTASSQTQFRPENSEVGHEATDPSPDQLDHVKGDLEVGAIFVSMPYLYLAAYALTLDSIEIVNAVAHLAFSFTIFNSFLQLMWILSTMWLEKVGGSLEGYQKMAIRGTIFLVLVLMSTMQILSVLLDAIFASHQKGPESSVYWSDALEEPLRQGGECIIVLLYTYAMLLAWVPRHALPRNESAAWKVRERVRATIAAIGFSLCPVLVSSQLSEATIDQIMWPSVTFATVAVLGYGVILMVLERGVQSCSQSWQRSLRSVALFLLLVVSGVGLWRIGRESFDAFDPDVSTWNEEIIYLFRPIAPLFGLLLTFLARILVWNCIGICLAFYHGTRSRSGLEDGDSSPITYVR